MAGDAAPRLCLESRVIVKLGKILNIVLLERSTSAEETHVAKSNYSAGLIITFLHSPHSEKGPGLNSMRAEWGLSEVNLHVLSVFTFLQEYAFQVVESLLPLPLSC